jgi:hypothetical protein
MKGRGHTEYQDITGGLELKGVLEEHGVTVLNGFMWCRRGTSDSLCLRQEI